MAFIERFKNDLIESKLTWGVALLFIPVAFFTYVFHEFGHWLIGEILGNDMVLCLNNANAQNGSYIDSSHALYISMGGPIFTILQATVALLIVEKTKSIYVYPFLFFAVFCRFFSIVFGGFQFQDEARIASILGIWPFTFAILVLLILFLIIWRSNVVLKLKWSSIGHYFAISTFSILLVIGVSNFFVIVPKSG